MVTLIFFTGFLCAFFHLFEIGSESTWFQRIKPILAIIILFLCIGIRWLRAYDATYCKYDAFITAPIIYNIVTLLAFVKPVSYFFCKLGKYSTYMWLTHTFFCFYYTSYWIFSFRISLLMFIMTFVVSWFTAIILTMIEKGLNQMIFSFISKITSKDA